MQTQTNMDRGVIEDYHHMTTIDKLNKTNTSIVNLILKTLDPPPFCTSTFISRFLVAFLNAQTKEK